MSDGTTNTARIAARTDVGQRRDHNEDALVAAYPLIAVADGVGGSAKGEVASQLALDTLERRVAEIAHAATADEAVAAMEAAVLLANRAVHDAQLTDDSLQGMATTLVAAVLRDGGELIVGHVGDSRLYVVSAAGARQATEDHSIVAELVRTGRIEREDAAHHPQRNVITRALGPEDDVSVDAFVLHVGPGDWVLLCSDGLTEHISDDELGRAMLETAHRDPEAAVERLVEQANLRGGTDNITVVIAQPVPSDVSGELSVVALDVATTGPQPIVSTAPADASGPLPVVDAAMIDDELPELSPLPIEEPTHDEVQVSTGRGGAFTRAFALVVGGIVVAALVLAFVWSRSYFVTERDNGLVGIDRGFPALNLSRPVRTSTVEAKELSRSERADLVDSHRLLDRDQAERVLDQLPDRVASGLVATPEAAGADATTP